MNATSPPETVKTLARKVLRISLLVAIFMAMAGFGAYVALTLIIKGEDTVVVPDLVGKDVLYGLQILSDLGLNTRVKATEYHDRVPKNHVIDQDPNAGAAIKRGRDVKIRVSRGPKTTAMPNLAGLSLQQSRILLTENGLCQGSLAGMSSSGNTVDQVMSQYPPPGATISRDTCADLLISRGPPRRAFAMPDLSGLTLEAAIRRLEQLQLKVGRIGIVPRISAPLETVVDQNPLAGHRVSLNSRIDLTVSQAGGNKHIEDLEKTDSVEWFRFSLEYGFLKKRVQVKMKHDRISLDLFDDYLAPGQEIWLLVPKNGNPTILVYVDGHLIETRIMDGR